MSDRLIAGGGRPSPEAGPLVRSDVPGRGPLMAVMVLTGVVLVFAAAVAFWMYWLQG